MDILENYRDIIETFHNDYRDAIFDLPPDDEWTYAISSDASNELPDPCLGCKHKKDKGKLIDICGTCSRNWDDQYQKG
jgi:hypothetical protein